MPSYLRDELPCIFSHRSAIDKDLMNLLRPCFYEGLGPSAFSNILLELHSKKHSNAHVNYLRKHAVFRENEKVKASKNLFYQSAAFDYIEPFSALNDKTGYHGMPARYQYLEEMYCREIENHVLNV